MTLTYLHSTEICGKLRSEKRDDVRQDIISNDGCMENCIKLRINTMDKSTSDPQDNTIANTYGNKFIIPFNFEMSDSAMPYYQSGLRNRLCYEIMFNEYRKAINANSQAPTPDARYKINDIALRPAQTRKHCCRSKNASRTQKMFRKLSKAYFAFKKQILCLQHMLRWGANNESLGKH